MSSLPLRRMLVISLGNPGAMRTTYHSAGHMILESLPDHMPLGQSEFSSQRIGRQTALTSVGRRHTLVQSPTLMNVSGPWVARAYQDTLGEHGLAPSELGVIVVHDDLEEALGVVKIREWTRSPRGHNGDKSDVSEFVLSQMPRRDRGVEDSEQKVFQALAQLEEGWGGEVYP
ncbi:hypothetical protein N0V88_002120 [Collariella sp. IMI 366227]|nr:hypothetical protein N0V88_002120 [Collariella sp. IMI 366227]